MICLDTNIIIELFKGNRVIGAELASQPTSSLCISAVVAAELYQGVLNGAELKRIEAGIARFVLLPTEAVIGANMLLLMRQFTLSHRLSFPDALIAATSLHYGLPLFTLNRKDFRYIPGLQLHEPA